MNDERRVTPEDDLRAALAPDDTITPLDPARVIAGARRRRKVRGLATAGVASAAVLAIAAGGLLASDWTLGTSPEPADPPLVVSTEPTPTPTVRPTPLPTPLVPTPSSLTPGSTITSGSSVTTPGPTASDPPTQGSASTPTVTSCLLASAGEPAPGPAAKQRGILDGSLIVVADSNYWMACDTTFRTTPSARRPAELQRLAVQDNDAFAVANNVIETAAGHRDYFWAAGMLPAGVATVRYSFVDGAVVDAKVSNGFWMMRHVSSRPPGAHDLGDRVRVQLLSPTGAVLNDVRLNWGTQTCAQITHGC
ncbi:hypothetical protein AB0H36_09545 [Kribbella sp. NPDC050820]|uniref:hypothetical protein n=1 Tax=Kribbella sp. NPDC050820 TaxID=3155408 RepID=UPI00340C9A24